MKKIISSFILLAFCSVFIFTPSPSLAALTGTIKIFSEVNGVEIFVDNVLKGVDVTDIKNVEPGQRYVKAVLNGTVIFSDLVTVNPGASTSVLIKSSGEVQKKILSSLSKEQQEYKSKKIDVLLSKKVQTVGSSYSSSATYPGYYSVLGSAWTSSSSTAYETADIKIIKGGVEEITEYDLGVLTNNKDILDAYAEDEKQYNDKMGNVTNWYFGPSAIILVSSALGIAAQQDWGWIGLALGCEWLFFGFVEADKVKHHWKFFKPAYIAKIAYEYNQGLKKTPGLPEDFEPGVN